MKDFDLLTFYDYWQQAGLSDDEIYKKLDEEADKLITYVNRKKEAENYVYKEDEEGEE